MNLSELMETTPFIGSIENDMFCSRSKGEVQITFFY